MAHSRSKNRQRSQPVTDRQDTSPLFVADEVNGNWAAYRHAAPFYPAVKNRSTRHARPSACRHQAAAATSA